MTLDKSDFIGKKKKFEFKCVCGNDEFKLNNRLKYLKVGIFPLLPVYKKPTLTCCKCLRNYDAKKEDRALFPKYSNSFILYHFSGWPAILAIYTLVYFSYSSIFPEDKNFRESPKVGDIYFLNYYNASKSKKEEKHPYRLARLVAYSEEKNLLELEIGRWSHASFLKVYNDYVAKKYAYNNEFLAKTILVYTDILDDRKIVLSVRRKNSLLDLEKQQHEILFKKEFLDYPRLSIPQI